MVCAVWCPSAGFPVLNVAVALCGRRTDSHGRLRGKPGRKAQKNTRCAAAARMVVRFRCLTMYVCYFDYVRPPPSPSRLKHAAFFGGSRPTVFRPVVGGKPRGPRGASPSCMRGGGGAARRGTRERGLGSPESRELCLLRLRLLGCDGVVRAVHNGCLHAAVH